MPNNVTRAILREIVTRVLIETQGMLIPQQADVVARALISAGFRHPQVNPPMGDVLDRQIGVEGHVEGAEDIRQAEDLNRFARKVTNYISLRFTNPRRDLDADARGYVGDSVQEILQGSDGGEEIPPGGSDGPGLDEDG